MLCVSCQVVFSHLLVIFTGAGRIDTHTGTLNINASLLLPGMTYVFTVILTSSDGRVGLATVQVEVIEEPILPIVTIR